MQKTLTFLVLSAIILGFSNQTILITQPAVTNFAKNQVEYWFANFGTVHYNKPMSFSIYPTNISLCGNQDEKSIKKFTNPTYIIVKQGDCSFTKKAYQAQLLGAQGIIIASQDVNYAQGNVIISDDGQGRKIRIAVLFIKIQDFDKLSVLNNAQIKVNFELSKRDKSIVQLFLSASGRQNYIFLRNFRKYYSKLNQNIKININYHSIQCKGCDQTQCILQKTCCTFDLDNYQSGMGKYIIYQQFRQHKIFSYFSQRNNIDQWFQYMDRFDKRCDYDWINSEQCSKTIQQELGITQLQFVNEQDLINKWRNAEVKTGIISLPDISVNGYRHVEILSAQSAFEMICQSMSSVPSGCQGQVVTPTNKTAIVAVVIISSIIFIISGIFCYRKVIRREITNDMSSKVNELVAKYAAKVSQQKKKRKDKLMERMTEQL